MKWYRAVTWDPSDRYIEEMEVERETRQRVWVGSVAHWKKTAIGVYFRTFGEAQDHLVRLAEKEVLIAKNRLSAAKERLRQAEALTEGDVR